MSADTTDPSSIPGGAWTFAPFSGMAWDIMGYHGRQSILGGQQAGTRGFLVWCVKGLWMVVVGAGRGGPIDRMFLLYSLMHYF
jgi:hypothetical protein